MTVVFDAGQNSVADFAHLAAAGLSFVGSVPPSDYPDLLARPAKDRSSVDAHRFGGLTALQTHRTVYGGHRRVVLTHPATAQSRGFDQTLAKACAQLSELADVLARGKTRRNRDQVSADIDRIIHNPWTKRVINVTLTGDTPVMSLSVRSGGGLVHCADVPPGATSRPKLPALAHPQRIHIPPPWGRRG